MNYYLFSEEACRILILEGVDRLGELISAGSIDYSLLGYNPTETVIVAELDSFLMLKEITLREYNHLRDAEIKFSKRLVNPK